MNQCVLNQKEQIQLGDVEAMLCYRIQSGKDLIVCSSIFYMRELGPAQTEAFYKNKRKRSSLHNRVLTLDHWVWFQQ